MMNVPYVFRTQRTLAIFFSLLITLSFVSQNYLIKAQTAAQATASQPVQAKPAFRLERPPGGGGAELLTIFGSLDGLTHDDRQANEVPLVSLLRDTLGDENPENDRLRYLWMLTYTKPTAWQKLAGAVPFLYNRVGSKKSASKGEPPALIDLNSSGGLGWNKFLWIAFQSFVLDGYGFPVKAPVRTYRRNVGDYRQAHVVRALAILSLYESATGGSQIFTATEMHDIQARLMLSEKTLGSLVDDVYLQHVYEKQTATALDFRGHNWELLRQRAEAESLYFEPLTLPDGSATHALLWVARPDLAKFRDKKFQARFLNIANPWRDDRLRFWNGYVETRYFDAENRPVAPNTPGAHPVQMIPLALYGLDYPKIPILLVDFRQNLNAKGREMSRRVLDDVARNVLELSKFGDIPYFFGRTVYDWVTGRRGMDVNQPSRLRAYSQLKLLLSLSASLDPDLRDEIKERVEHVSLNPLENDTEAEARLAREQYAALMAYATRPDGLPAKLDRDRRAEMVPLVHGTTEQVFFRLGKLLTLGMYTHREKATPELLERMEIARRIKYHDRFLREVAKSSPVVEVVWNIEDIRRSLRFMAEHGEEAGGKTAKAVSRIFTQTEDEETRKLCLNSLYRINNETAKKELLALYQDEKVTGLWRVLIAEYLRTSVREAKRIAPKDEKVIISVIGQ